MERRPAVAGRPRMYANAAEKMRAYREKEETRIVLVDRIWFEQTQQDLNRLWHAVHDAQKSGHEIALSLDLRSKTDVLQGLAVYFETGAATSSPMQKKDEKGARCNSKEALPNTKKQPTTKREK